MYNGPVTHRDLIAENRRKTASGHMERGLVLDIRSFADANPLDITPQNGPKEDARIPTDLDIADDGRSGRDPHTFV